MKLVILESPLAGEVEENIRFARACMRHSVMLGEAPFASHLLYAQGGILDDLDPQERTLGIEAGLAWGKKADLTVVYTNRGISRGMQMGIDRAMAEGRPVQLRVLPDWK